MPAPRREATPRRPSCPCTRAAALTSPSPRGSSREDFLLKEPFTRLKYSVSPQDELASSYKLCYPRTYDVRFNDSRPLVARVLPSLSPAQTQTPAAILGVWPGRHPAFGVKASFIPRTTRVLAKRMSGDLV